MTPADAAWIAGLGSVLGLALAAAAAGRRKLVPARAKAPKKS